MIRNKFHTKDHEILGATADFSRHGDLALRIYASMVYETELGSQIFPLFEDICAPQDFPSTTYLALLVSLPTQKFCRPLRWYYRRYEIKRRRGELTYNETVLMTNLMQIHEIMRTILVAKNTPKERVWNTVWLFPPYWTLYTSSNCFISDKSNCRCILRGTTSYSSKVESSAFE